MEAFAGVSFTLGPVLLGLLAWNAQGATGLMPYAVMAGAIVVMAVYVALRWQEKEANQAR